MILKNSSILISTLLFLVGCATCPTKVADVKPSSDYSTCNFDGLNLRGADFSNSNLVSSSFINSDLTGAKFNGSVITDADFRYSNLSGASFIGAYSGRFIGSKVIDLTGFKTFNANLSNTIWMNGSVCSNGSITVCN